jgi:cation diffusion facilitator CzcD-associated flavoprotein CzcO
MVFGTCSAGAYYLVLRRELQKAGQFRLKIPISVTSEPLMLLLLLLLTNLFDRYDRPVNGGQRKRAGCRPWLRLMPRTWRLLLRRIVLRVELRTQKSPHAPATTSLQGRQHGLRFSVQVTSERVKCVVQPIYPTTQHEPVPSHPALESCADVTSDAVRARSQAASDSGRRAVLPTSKMLQIGLQHYWQQDFTRREGNVRVAEWTRR